MFTFGVNKFTIEDVVKSKNTTSLITKYPVPNQEMPRTKNERKPCMNNLEIERKYLINELPFSLKGFDVRIIEQGYLCTRPVVRIRRDNNKYELTYKSGGLLKRREETLPLSKEAYEHLATKIDGRLIQKKRYMIPLDGVNSELTIELDIFEGDLAPLMLAEVEFPDEETANQFTAPDWFGADVTFCGQYHNSYLSQK